MKHRRGWVRSLLRRFLPVGNRPRPRAEWYCDATGAPFCLQGADYAELEQAEDLGSTTDEALTPRSPEARRAVDFMAEHVWRLPPR